jgi:hypothetical protein
VPTTARTDAPTDPTARPSTSTAGTPVPTRPTGQPAPRETAAAGGAPSPTTRPPETGSSYGNPYGTPSTGTSSTYGRPVGQPVPQPIGKPVQAQEATAATPGMIDPHPSSARETSGKRVYVALAISKDQRCEDPRWRNSEECIPILQRKRQREQQGGG